LHQFSVNFADYNWTKTKTKAVDVTKIVPKMFAYFRRLHKDDGLEY